MSAPSASSGRTPFDDLDDYLALGRVSGLALSPDGTRLVVALSTLNEKRTAHLSALWEVDPAGVRPARRITWGPKSETAPAFLPDGSLIFTSGRPAPGAETDDDAPSSLWMMTPGGGEARQIAVRGGGIGTVVIARDAGTLVLGAGTIRSAITREQDDAARKARKDLLVSAVLHDSYPVRFWDADLGPERTRLFVGSPDSVAGSGGASSGLIELRDLTGDIGGAISGESSWSLSPDGRTVAVSLQQLEPAGSARQTLVAIDVATGERRVLLDDPDFEYYAPAFSPDGGRIALTAEWRAQPGAAVNLRLVVLDLDSGKLSDAAGGWDRWPANSPVWTPDGSALLLTADDNGRSPIWRIDLAATVTGPTTTAATSTAATPTVVTTATTTAGAATAIRLTSDDAAYSDLQLSRDGSALFALRSAIGSPPAPVRLDPRLPGQTPTPLLGPVEAPALPGTVIDLSTTAADGTTVRGWLVLPTRHDLPPADAEAAGRAGAGAGAEGSGDAGGGDQQPAPLLVWIHGGPLSSWSTWSWRWSPWLAAARGYAVLLPDPALSTGYGQAAIDRGWGEWGAASYTDVMALTDAAVARPDIDADATAAMGGSFGGYLANWIAGHTDRFRAIVSHAGLWAFDQFGPTTDGAYYWRREMSAQMAAAHSPHHFVDAIRTPMLLIHGDRDYRVPVGESIRLFTELAERGTSPDGVLAHRFLLFPDENHWVLKPQNAKLWYQTVFAFLAQTVRGQPWQAPDLLS